MNTPYRIRRLVFLSSSLLLMTSLAAQSKDSDWYLRFDVANVRGEVSGNNTAAGIALGYQLSDIYSLELTSRNLVSGDESGQLNSAMAVWRSQSNKMYFKLSGGMTLGSGDLFEDNSASFGLGIGYATDSQWSIELDVIRLSDDVNAISVSTQYRF